MRTERPERWGGGEPPEIRTLNLGIKSPLLYR
jgi:hypothetical protein